MKTLNSILGRASVLLAVGSILSLPGSARAATVTLSVDPSQSTLTAGGWAFTPTLVFGPITPGATVDAWGGTITGDLTGGIFTFSGGSSIVALLNPVSPQPWPTLSPAFSTSPWPTISGMDNYGMIAGPTFVPGYGIVTVRGAYRSLSLDLTAGTATAGSPTTMTVAMTGGFLDWGATAGTTPFGGTSLVATGPTPSAANASAGLVSWDGTTLTLPIQIENSLSSNSHETWTGTLVATLVPEPSTVALTVVGLGLLAAARRARRS